MKPCPQAPHIQFQSHGITVVRPSARLGQYVRVFTLFDFAQSLQIPSWVVSLPMGDVCLWLQTGNRLTTRRFGALPASSVVGPQTSMDSVQLERGVDSLCIEFKPAGARAFFQRPLSELKDAALPLDALWPRCFVQALQDTKALPPLQQIVQIERLLLQRLDDRWAAPRRTQHALALIYAQQGQTSIRSLAQALHLSKSQLGRTFANHVGIAPKVFARQYRFTHAFTNIQQQRAPRWADFAARHGYADQSHLIRECVAFTGFTPSQLAVLDLNASFVQDEWRATS